MKRFLSFLVAVSMSSTLMAQAVIKFEKSSHNFGAFKEDKPQTCEFVFTNTGDKPLVIQQAYGSCGCTVPSFPKEPIFPGKKGVIKVTFNGKNQFLGSFQKAVTVRSNATNATTRLYIRGTIQKAD